MDKLSITGKDGNTVAEIFSFLEAPTKNKKEFIESILDKVPFSEEIGFAGYASKEGLERTITNSIYGNKIKKWNSITLAECKKEIEFVTDRCSEIIGNKVMNIFLFPTINEFIIEKLEGVVGYSDWKNTLLLMVSRTEKWKDTLKITLFHELAHALELNYTHRKTIEDDIIFEGIAEHFAEHFAETKSNIVTAISEKQVKQILLEIKPKLKSTDNQLFRELFYGEGKYPKWAGYTIGYNIVSKYLDKHPKKWSEIIKIKPSKIMKDSEYLSSI